MKCCKENNNSNSGHSHPVWMMVLCCSVPIVLSIVISFLGTSGLAIAGVVPYLCPILMIAMMLMMHVKNKKRELPRTQRIELWGDK